MRNSANFPSDSRFTGGDRGIGASPVSMTSSMPQSGGNPGGAPPSTSAYSTERGEGRVVVAGEVQLRVRQAKRRDVQLRAVPEHLYPPAKRPSKRGATRLGPPAPGGTTPSIGGRSVLALTPAPLR